MTGEPIEGGRRRIDRVLGPEYLAGLAGLSLEDLRIKRHEAEQEEADLSYSRRLLQGRADLLQSALSRLDDGDADGADAAAGGGGGRVGAAGAGGAGEGPGGAAGDGDRALVDRLAHAMADMGGRSDHGLGRYLSVQPSRIGDHRRAAEQMAADVALSDVGGSTPAEITAALARVRAVEADISGSRRRVQDVMDACTAEIGRRYRDGVAHVDDLLAER